MKVFFDVDATTDLSSSWAKCRESSRIGAVVMRRMEEECVAFEPSMDQGNRIDAVLW